MTTTTPPTPEQGKQPVVRLRYGRIHASVWENAGPNGPRHTVTFERRYQDAAGTWQSSHSYNAGELLLLAKAADRAHDFVLSLRHDQPRG